MDFLCSEEQEAFIKVVEKFARKEVAPGAEERDETGKWDDVLWKKIGAMGLCGLPISEEYGGGGADAVTSFLAYEAFMREGLDAGVYLSLGAHIFICSIPILLHGSEEQKQKYLPKLASGEWIGALALTEPNVGSDAAGIETTARLEGDHYIINGSKMFITNGSNADVFLVMASTDRSKRGNGVTAFLVDKGTPGLEVSRKLNKMGHRSSPTAELAFVDMKVPVSSVIGKVGEGFHATTDALVWERGVFLAAESVGIMGAVLKLSLEYAKTRKQFGRPLAEQQMIREKLAEMKYLYDAAYLLSLKACWMKDCGKDGKYEAGIAKAFYAEALAKVTDHGVQIHGGYGYMREYHVERLYRDQKLMAIGGGTTEIQKLIISSNLIRG